MTDTTNYHLDITGELCPLTFVKTKLLIERMQSGETLDVRLQGVEPIRNVPRSVAELGHVIVSITAEPGESSAGIHHLMIMKV
ncbi:MAG TPA: sulfurtransferase TusA family protein [Patescibacteria group bacterium]|nr:sulfurtransferase TusA family protein [Patescibacteria group bacterium]